MVAEVKLIARPETGEAQSFQFKPGEKFTAHAKTQYKIIVDGSENLPPGTKITRSGSNVVVEFPDGQKFEFTNWCGIDNSKLVELDGRDALTTNANYVPATAIESGACSIADASGQTTGTLGEAGGTTAAASPPSEGMSPGMIGGIIAGVVLVGAAVGGGGGGGGGGSGGGWSGAPAAPSAAAAMTAASDSGSSSSDGISNDSTPGFAISTPLTGTTPVLFVDGVEVAASFDSGTNTLTPTTPLGDGSHTITVALRNSSGTSAQSPGLAVTIDTTAPATSASPDMTAATDSGSNSTDNISNDPTPTFTIAAPGAGETPSLYLDGVKVAATFDSLTNTFTPTVALTEGTHNVSHTITDAAGNESARSADLAVTIDLTAPAAPASPDMTAATDSGSSNTDNLTRDDTPSFAIPAPAVGQTASLYVDGVKVAATFDGLTNTLTPTVALTDGAHNISHTIADIAGNESAQSAALPIVIDTIAGSMSSITSAPENSGGGINDTEDNNGTTIDVAIPNDAAAGNLLTINIGGQTVSQTITAPNVGNTMTVTIPKVTLDALVEGSHAVTATLTDAAGNVSAPSAPFSITLDRIAPGKPIAPDMSALTDTGQFNTDEVTGNSRPSFEIAVPASGETPALYVDGVKVAATLSQNPFIATIFYLTPINPIADGAHNITYTMSDAAGNESVASDPLSVTVDTLAPATPAPAPDLAAASDSGISSTDNYTSEERPAFTGTGVAGDRVRLYVDGVAYQTTAIAGDGSFSVAPSTSLADGVHSITYSFLDTAGNESGKSSGLNVTIDTTPVTVPTISQVSENNLGGIDFTEAGNGTVVSIDIPADAKVGDVLTLKVGAPAPDAIHTILAGEPGTTISVTIPGASLNVLAPGAHDLVATIADHAGNVSAPSVPFAITLIGSATTAPTITSVPDNTAGGINGAEASDGVVVNVDLSGVQTSAGALNPLGGDTLRVIINGINTDVVLSVLNVTNGFVAVAIPPASIALVADGTHAVTAVVFDGAVGGGSGADGNPDPVSAQFKVTLDRIELAPVIALDMTSTTDTGVVTADNKTSNTTPDFIGTGPVGDTVTLLVGPDLPGAVAVGMATIQSDGSFVVTPSVPLADGNYSAWYTFTDAAGNVSGTVFNVLNFTIDTTKPGTPALAPDMTSATDSGSSNSDNYTGFAQPVFNITAPGANTVTFYVDGVAVPFSPVGGNNYRLTSPIPDGAHNITYTLTDDAGNESIPSPALSFMIDTTPVSIPSISSIPENSGGGIDATEAADGTAINVEIPSNASINDVLTLNVGGQLVTHSISAPEIGGTASVTAGKPTLDLLSDGSHTVTATVTDLAGNVSVTSAPFTLTLNRAASLVSSSSVSSNGAQPDQLGDTLQLSDVLGPSAMGVSINSVHSNVASNHLSTLLQNLIDSANTPS